MSYVLWIISVPTSSIHPPFGILYSSPPVMNGVPFVSKRLLAKGGLGSVHYLHEGAGKLELQGTSFKVVSPPRGQTFWHNWHSIVYHPTCPVLKGVIVNYREGGRETGVGVEVKIDVKIHQKRGVEVKIHQKRGSVHRPLNWQSHTAHMGSLKGGGGPMSGTTKTNYILPPSPPPIKKIDCT